jgi:serine protease Do
MSIRNTKKTLASRPAAWLAVGLLSLGLLGCGAGDTVEAQPQRADEPIREQLGKVPETADTTTAEALSSAFRAASNRALPAVVYIQVEKEAPARAMPINPFQRFFGQPQPEGEAPPQQGAGSGFLLDREGHVVTNTHVVADASYLLVRLVDGREYEAEIVGTDASTDVAVIKIDPGEGEELPVADLGDSEPVQVGDWVLALGSPLGLDFTVTAGIVSAKGRQISGRQAALEAFIQTDAAINPGNSGGPLVDLAGRVVGINTAIFGGGPRFVGYGFAIPIDLAERVIGDLLEYGYVRRPQLGVRVSDVTAVDAEAYGLDEVRGAEVNAVDSDGAAADAGLEPGDVIVALDGEQIADATELTTELAEMQPGDRVKLAVVRGGERRDFEVELGEFEHAEQAADGGSQHGSAEETLGFRVEPLTAEIADRFGYTRTSGVVISQVRPFSSAANAGIRPGFLLLAIDGEAVASPRDVQRVAGDIEPGSVVSLRVEVPEFGETIVNYRAQR